MSRHDHQIMQQLQRSKAQSIGESQPPRGVISLTSAAEFALHRPSSELKQVRDQIGQGD